MYAKWRYVALFVGLLAATLNAVLLACWVIWLHFHYSTESLRVESITGNIGAALCVAGFVGSAAGEGVDRARILVSVSAVLGFLVWAPVGIL